MKSNVSRRPGARVAAARRSPHPSCAAGRCGILDGGASYGCVFTGGAAENLFNFATLKRPTRTGLLRTLSALTVIAWVAVKSLVLTGIELGRAVLRLLADPVAEWRRGWK